MKLQVTKLCGLFILSLASQNFAAAQNNAVTETEFYQNNLHECTEMMPVSSYYVPSEAEEEAVSKAKKTIRVYYHVLRSEDRGPVSDNRINESFAYLNQQYCARNIQFELGSINDHLIDVSNQILVNSGTDINTNPPEIAVEGTLLKLAYLYNLP